MEYLKSRTIFNKNNQLPFEVIRGNFEERNKKAGEFAKKFSEVLDVNVPKDELCSIKDIDKSLKEVLAPHYIDICYKREKENATKASFQKSIKGEQQGNILNIFIEKYRFAFRTIDTSQKDIEKSAAIHEVRHFFDDLFNPKLAIFRFFGVENKAYAKYVSPFFKKMMDFNEDYCVLTIFKDYKKIKKELPIKAKIDALQRTRYHLITEKNAYKDELKYNLRHPIKNFLMSLDLIYDHFLIRKPRLAMVTYFLKQELKNARKLR